jgi:hypothetical protein
VARSFRLPEPGSPEIRVEPDLLRGPRVYVDGREVERRRERGRPFWPVTVEGKERRILLAGHLTGLRAIVDGADYPIERRLELWELALSFLPLALVTIGGALGGLLGALAVGGNLALMRRPWPPVARAVGALALGIGALVATAAVGQLILG